MRGPEDFGAAFTALLDAAGTNPDGIVRALAREVVTRGTLYEWKRGTHLPDDARPLVKVVKLCLRLAGAGSDLRGAPRDVQGWLELLAEAKQTRDNQAARRGPASGRSSLLSLDQDALEEVVGFLAGRAARLLEELDKLIATGRPDRADELLDRLEKAQGRYQTPHCVAKPKILPAADLSVAYQCADLLRTYRMILPRRGLGGDRLIDTISALREALEEIYGVRIVFVGEKIAKTAGNTESTTPSDFPISAGAGIDFDPRVQDPIITSVKVLPEMASPEIVAEGNPPEAVTPSRSIFVIKVEARAPRAVFLDGARVLVLDRRPPRRACFIRGIGGVVEVRRCDVDFDSKSPQLRMRGKYDFPLTVSPGDPEEFWVQAVTAKDEITWTIALDWTVNGISGTTLLNHGSPSFSLYPLNVRTGPDGQSLYTACDYAGHEDGCPSLTLERLGGSTSTFYSAGDLANGSLYTGIPALRDMVSGG